MKIKIILTFALPILMLGCSKTPTEMYSTHGPVLVSEWDNIKLNESGEVYVNKKKVSMAELEVECQRLKKIGGGAKIYYSDFRTPLTQTQTEVLKKLAEWVPLKAVQNEKELD